MSPRQIELKSTNETQRNGTWTITLLLVLMVALQGISSAASQAGPQETTYPSEALLQQEAAELTKFANTLAPPVTNPTNTPDATVFEVVATRADQVVQTAINRWRDVAANEDLITAFEATFNARVPDAVAGLHTSDAILAPPSEATLVGRAAIQSWLESRFARANGETMLALREIEIAGPWAFVRVLYATKLAAAVRGQPTDDHGTFLAINLRQPDGSWRIHRMVWNNSPSSDELKK